MMKDMFLGTYISEIAFVKKCKLQKYLISEIEE